MGTEGRRPRPRPARRDRSAHRLTSTELAPIDTATAATRATQTGDPNLPVATSADPSTKLISPTGPDPAPAAVAVPVTGRRAPAPRRAALWPRRPGTRARRPPSGPARSPGSPPSSPLGHTRAAIVKSAPSPTARARLPRRCPSTSWTLPRSHRSTAIGARRAAGDPLPSWTRGGHSGVLVLQVDGAGGSFRPGG